MTLRDGIMESEWLMLKGEVIWCNPTVGPVQLVMQIHLEKLLSYPVIHSNFKYLQRWQFYHLSGQSVPGLSQSYHEKVLSDIQTELPVSFFPLCHWSCPWAPLRRTWLHHLCHPPFRNMYTAVRSLWAFISSG